MKFFKKKEPQYTEISQLVAYDKFIKVLDSCVTAQQLINCRLWIREVYYINEWDFGMYYRHLNMIYELKWDKIITSKK